MSSSNCCFLTCIQRQVRWSGIPISFRIFHSFLWSIDFGIVNKAEIDAFLELSCFFYDPVDVGNLISDSSAFLNPAWTSGSSRFTYYWSLAWRISSITFLACEMHATVRYFEHSLAFPFFGIGMKTDLFQSCCHCWVFHIFSHIDIFWGTQFNPLTVITVHIPEPPAELPLQLENPSTSLCQE